MFSKLNLPGKKNPGSVVHNLIMTLLLLRLLLLFWLIPFSLKKKLTRPCSSHYRKYYLLALFFRWFLCWRQ